MRLATQERTESPPSKAIEVVNTGFSYMKKSNSELRKFGLVMAVPLALIGGLMLWRGREGFWWLFGIAAFFLVSGLAVPMVLAPIKKAWMAFARVLSIGMTYVVLTLTFFVVIMPVGFLMRLAGKDSLKLKWKSSEATFWEAVEPDGPTSRADKPY